MGQQIYQLSQKPRRGFTLVELLVVIVVLGILATIIMVSYHAVRRRAQIISVVDGLTKVEKAFRIWAIDESLESWPVDGIDSGGISLQTLIDETSLKGQLQSPPSVVGVQTEDWFFDNDNDTKPAPCGNNYDGVNIVIRFVEDPKIIEGVDKEMDDGNLNCGKIRGQDERIFLVISRDQSVPELP